MKTIRAFVAVDIEPRKEVVSLLYELKSSQVKVKVVEPENMHLTLKFLGDIGEKELDIISEGMEAFRSLPSFDIRLSKVGAFPSARKPKVIWIGVVAEGMKNLWELMEGISEKAGIERDRRDFSPHLTLGRVKDLRNSWKLEDFIETHRNDDFGAIHVSSVKLKKSVLTPDGPIYSNLLSIGLKGP